MSCVNGLLQCCSVFFDTFFATLTEPFLEKEPPSRFSGIFQQSRLFTSPESFWLMLKVEHILHHLTSLFCVSRLLSTTVTVNTEVMTTNEWIANGHNSTLDASVVKSRIGDTLHVALR